MNEFSTCRSELKKLAKILVGSDPDLFPLHEDQAKAFEDQPTPEICVIAARLEKTWAKGKGKSKAEQLHDPKDVHDLVTGRLAQFAYLNYPPTTTVSPDSTPVMYSLTIP